MNEQIASPRASSFPTSANDPGFLVAKGRFRCDSERQRDDSFRERDDLIRQGISPASDQVISLTQSIDNLNKTIDSERDFLERKHVKSLASAIFMAMTNHGYANVRAVGRAATYNAVKSIAIAEEYCKSKDMDPRCDIKFDEGNLGSLRSKTHVQSVTAMLFKLKDVNRKQEATTV